MSKMYPVRIKRIAAEGSWIIFGQVAVVLGSLALVRVLTGLLSPAEYGQLALGLTLVTLFNQVVFGPLSAGINRYYTIAVSQGELGNYFAGSRKLVLYGASIAILTGLMLASGSALSGSSQWIGFALAASALAVFGGCNSILNGIQNAARQRATVAMHSGLDAWLKIASAILFLRWLGQTSVAVILGFSISALMVTMSQIVILMRIIRPSNVKVQSTTPWDWAAKIWNYSRPFSTWGVFTWMQQASDRWALNTFATSQDVGFYIVVFQLGYTPIVVVLGLIMNFLTPIIFSRAGDAASVHKNHEVSKIIWRTTAITLIFTGFAVLSASIIHEYIFALLVSPEFHQASYLLPWVVLSGGLFAAGQMLSLSLMSEMNANQLIAPKIVTAIMGVIFNVVGAALGGIEGIVISLLCFSTIYLLWIILILKRKL